MSDRKDETWRDINSVTLRGRLGRDPEFRSTSWGAEEVKFTLATSEVWKDKQSGERKERTTWHTVTTLAEQHVNTAKELRKGMRVSLTGSINVREFTGQDGAKRQFTEIALGKWGATLVVVPDDRKPAPAAATAGDADDEIPF